jgi:hypothetical protein
MTTKHESAGGLQLAWMLLLLLLQQPSEDQYPVH